MTTNPNTLNEDASALALARRDAESAIEKTLPPLLRRLAALDPLLASVCVASDDATRLAMELSDAAALQACSSPMIASAASIVASCAAALAAAEKTIKDAALDEAFSPVRWGYDDVAAACAAKALEAAATLAQEAHRVLDLVAAAAE